jgi:hypothetical protein
MLTFLINTNKNHAFIKNFILLVSRPYLDLFKNSNALSGKSVKTPSNFILLKPTSNKLSKELKAPRSSLLKV